MSLRIVNLRLEPWRSDASSFIYMGRPGKGVEGPFGNPFPRSVDCLKKFREHFLKRVGEDLDFRKAVLALARDPRPLACFCVDEDGNGDCHVRVIVEWLLEERLMTCPICRVGVSCPRPGGMHLHLTHLVSTDPLECLCGATGTGELQAGLSTSWKGGLYK